MTFDRQQAIARMLNGQKVRDIGEDCGEYYYYDATLDQPFRYVDAGGDDEPCQEAWEVEEWEIFEEVKEETFFFLYVKRDYDNVFCTKFKYTNFAKAKRALAVSFGKVEVIQKVENR